MPDIQLQQRVLPTPTLTICWLALVIGFKVSYLNPLILSDKWIFISMKKIFLFSLITFVIFLQGCSTLADARKAEGEGIKKVFPASFEKTWNASNTALVKLKLEIASENRDKGYILAQRGMTFFSYGENIAIFIKKQSDSQTTVEIVSKKSMATNIFAPDWTEDIFREIGVALRNN